MVGFGGEEGRKTYVSSLFGLLSRSLFGEHGSAEIYQSIMSHRLQNVLNLGVRSCRHGVWKIGNIKGPGWSRRVVKIARSSSTYHVTKRASFPVCLTFQARLMRARLACHVAYTLVDRRIASTRVCKASFSTTTPTSFFLPYSLLASPHPSFFPQQAVRPFSSANSFLIPCN